MSQVAFIVPYLIDSAVVIHYEEALYQVYASLPFLPSVTLKSGARWIRFFWHISIITHAGFDLE